MQDPGMPDRATSLLEDEDLEIMQHEKGNKYKLFKDTPRSKHHKIVMASLSTNALTNGSPKMSQRGNKEGRHFSADLLKSIAHGSNQGRIFPKAPERVLDAPDYLDDFYLKLVDWGACNLLAVALGACVYIWSPSSGQAEELLNLDERGHGHSHGDYVSSLKWIGASKEAILAIGLSDGRIELWNVQQAKKLRTISHDRPAKTRLNTALNDSQPHRIAALAWNRHVLTSGNRSGEIYHSDVRMRDFYISKIEHGHQQEVCGLAWSADGHQLASGGNDNRINIFEDLRPMPLHTMDAHRSAVKALAWCPWAGRVLASGGGTADQCIRTWNTTTATCLSETHCRSQVTSLLWSPSARHGELISTHGYVDNQVVVWRHPSMVKAAELRGHSGRILAATLSPDGSTLVTAGADENINFWKLYPHSAGAMSSDKVMDLLNSPLKSPIDKPAISLASHWTSPSTRTRVSTLVL